MVILLVAQTIETRQVTYEVALAEARGNFNKDLVYRRWSSLHGGVYVPITEQTPPNPDLAHIPERDITTPSGRRLTLVNPAYMTRQVHELAEQQSGVRGHITSLDPIRPQNAPDAWEHSALEAFERGVPEVIQRIDIQGRPFLRMMRPLVAEPACLRCHAEQGYVVGQVRGGISTSVPWEPYAAIFRRQMAGIVLGHGVLWLLGLGAIVYVDRRNRRHQLAAARSDAAFREHREKAAAELERKNRELQNVLYTASHDLRSPMLNIQGFSQRLQHRLTELEPLIETASRSKDEDAIRTAYDEAQRSLGFILSGVEKLDRLVAAMLRLSRLGQITLNKQAVDMNALIATALTELAFEVQTAGARIEVGPLLSCHGDVTLLGQAFANLLQNALKYRDPARPLSVRIEGESVPEGVVYHVIDNGRGIEARHLDQIWELFQRLDPSAGTGEGIGLNIVRRIIDRHDGRIWVDSTFGEGTRFHLHLPDRASAKEAGGPSPHRR